MQSFWRATDASASFWAQKTKNFDFTNTSLGETPTARVQKFFGYFLSDL
jgi:hypothetical protein